MNDHVDDDALLAELAEALRPTGPLAPGIAARAKASFTWRTIDQDLLTAELSFDSSCAPPVASRRAEPAAPGRVLVFSTELRSVEIEVLPDKVVGQFVPPGPGEVEVEGEQGVLTTVDVDELGFFVLQPVPQGLVRLRCTTPTTRIVTAWVRL